MHTMWRDKLVGPSIPVKIIDYIHVCVMGNFNPNIPIMVDMRVQIVYTPETGLSTIQPPAPHRLEVLQKLCSMVDSLCNGVHYGAIEEVMEWVRAQLNVRKDLYVLVA